jgi:hypothetical protein
VRVQDRFARGIASRWSRLCVGGGGLVVGPIGLRLVLPPLARGYGDAQIDDCQVRRADLPWHPPLRLSLRARLAPSLRGTAGFGFWNNPLGAASGPPALPRALWFLHTSPPSDLALAQGVPGYGWKAASIDATGPEALRWAPLAPLVLLLNRWPRFYGTVWPRVQRALRVREALLGEHDAWHSYTIEWRHDGAEWRVDEQTVLRSDQAPRGPLGFVAWVDNQWAAASARGHLGWGLLPTTTPQWLDLAELVIEPL